MWIRCRYLKNIYVSWEDYPLRETRPKRTWWQLNGLKHMSCILFAFTLCRLIPFCIFHISLFRWFAISTLYNIQHVPKNLKFLQKKSNPTMKYNQIIIKYTSVLNLLWPIMSKMISIIKCIFFNTKNNNNSSNKQRANKQTKSNHINLNASKKKTHKATKTKVTCSTLIRISCHSHNCDYTEIHQIKWWKHLFMRKTSK